MKKLTQQDLFTLEQYVEKRNDFRVKVMQHKKNRQLPIGPNTTLYFEDRLVMQYQIQEILRVEKIVKAIEIEKELAVYNPLIPDGSNWKATFMIEYPDETERHIALSKLIGIENKVWVQIQSCDKVYSIADEDIQRETEMKTSSVHFLRFELTSDMVAALKSGAALSAGIQHPEYMYTVNLVPKNVCNSLISDLD